MQYRSAVNFGTLSMYILHHISLQGAFVKVVSFFKIEQIDQSYICLSTLKVERTLLFDICKVNLYLHGRHTKAQPVAQVLDLGIQHLHGENRNIALGLLAVS